MTRSLVPKLSKKQMLVGGIVLTVALLSVGGWLVLSDSKTQNVSNYHECRKAAGSTVMLSYPDVCMTKDKQQFPNPDQQAVVPPVSKATDLTFKEWGSVGISIPGSGAYYTMMPDGVAYVTTTELESLKAQVQGCKSGLSGITIDRNLKEVGAIETMCMPAESDVTQRIHAIQASIRQALKSPATL